MKALLEDRAIRLGLATIAVALLCALWAWSRLSESRDDALASEAALADCQTAADRIETLRGRPTVAASRELRPLELRQRIAGAVREAGLQSDVIERIESEPPRRVGETGYREVVTLVRLSGATVQQAITFLHAAASGTEAPLQVRSVRLGTPHGPDSLPLWNVDATLAYMQYAPDDRGKPREAE